MAQSSKTYREDWLHIGCNSTRGSRKIAKFIREIGADGQTRTADRRFTNALAVVRRRTGRCIHAKPGAAHGRPRASAFAVSRGLGYMFGCRSAVTNERLCRRTRAGRDSGRWLTVVAGSADSVNYIRFQQARVIKFLESGLDTVLIKLLGLLVLNGGNHCICVQPS